MSIHADIKIALDGVAAVTAAGETRVYPDAAPQDAPLPFVIMRQTLNDPQMTLMGYSGITHSVYVFECWAKTKAVALSLAADVVVAIEASAIVMKFREPSSGEDYEPLSDQLVEPVQYSFWHA